VFVALFAAGAALLITPPLLLVVGDRVGTRVGAPKTGPGGWWYRWPRWVMRRHVDIALVSVLGLVAAAGPALGVRFTFPDFSSVPTGVETRTVSDIVTRDFAPNIETPVNVAIERAVPAGSRLAPAQVAGALRLAPGVAGAGPALAASRDTAFVQALLAQPPLSSASQELVRRLARLRPGLLVGGATAEFVDLMRSIARRAPLVAALVALATFAVLFVLTGSVVLPAKALLFHALALAAVFGLLVLVFQHGALGIAGVLGYRGPPALEVTVSVVIVASTFGLATDYSILLLSRITEEHEAGRSDEQAVAAGIERTGPVITSSALLLAVALLALTSSRLFLVKELTVGQVLGVVIDVTVVRLLLVPSFMRILGPRNWWSPGPLRRAHARMRPSGDTVG
jgi:RND superfamily putative drug exporter